MRKIVTVILISACLALGVFGCANMSNEKRANSEAAEVPKEAGGVNFVSFDGMTVGGEYVDFRAEEKRLLGCGPLGVNDSYYEWSRYTEDGVLFSHQYALRGDYIKENGVTVENANRADVGVFKADARSGRVTLLKNITGVIPFRLYETAHLPVVHGPFDGRHIVLTYNGRLEVISAADGRTEYSAQVYTDPESYACTQSGANAYFDGQNYVFIGEGALDYYVYGDGKFDKVSFRDPAIASHASASMRGGVVYVKEFGEPVFAGDLETGEKLLAADLKTSYNAAAESENSGESAAAPTECEIGGAVCEVVETREREQGYNSSAYDIRALKITDVATGKITSIDGDVLAKNASFVRIKDIYDKYFPDDGHKLALRSWNVDRGRLFLTVYRPIYKAYTNPKYTPAFIFEYLPQTDEVVYCGMSRDTFSRALAAEE